MDALNGFALWHAWWCDIANRRSPSTTDDYRGAVNRFFSSTGFDPLGVTDGQIKAFLKTKRTQHANLYRWALIDFFDFCYRRGVRADNPIAEIRRRSRRGTKLKRSLTEDELVRTLIAAVYLGRYRRLWEGGRVAMLMLAQYYAGLRPSEIVNVSTSSLYLDVADPYVEIVDTKTGADRMVPLNPRAVDVFRELARDRVGRLCDVGVTQYWSWVRRACRLAGVAPEKCRPYTFRHSFARHLLERGVAERDVAELLGHVSMSAMWGYTQPGKDALRGAVELL